MLYLCTQLVLIYCTSVYTSDLKGTPPPHIHTYTEIALFKLRQGASRVTIVGWMDGLSVFCQP